MSNDSIDQLCENCGQTFSTFLHEMAHKNAKVVCPNCRDKHDGDSPKSSEPGAGARPVGKPH